MVSALALLAMTVILWILLEMVTTSPESTAEDGATMATNHQLVPGSFHVLTTVPFPAERIVVYSARVRATKH